MLKSQNKNTFAYYSFFFAVISLPAFILLLSYGRSLMWSVDGFDQYYAIVANLRHSLGRFLRGEGFSFWGWSTGLGTDNISNFYAIYFDPFTYVMAAFPVKYMDLGYSVAMLFRLYFAGITALLFFRERQLSKAKSIIGALSYAFSMWSLTSFRQMSFYFPMVMFPLLIMSIDRTDKKKNPLLLIIVVAVLLINNLYFAYMAAIIAGLYFVIKYFVGDSNKNIFGFLKRLVWFVGYIFVSLAISLPVVLSVAYALMNTSHGTPFRFVLFYPLDQVMSFIPSLFTDQMPFSNYSAISVCAVILALIPSFAIKSNFLKNRLPIIMSLVCLIFLFFPVLSSVMNGFSYPQARWSYMLAFFLIWSGCESLDLQEVKAENGKKKYFVVLFLLLSVLAINEIVRTIFGITNERYLTYILINSVVVFFVALVITDVIKFNNPRKALVILCVINLVCITSFRFSAVISGGFSDLLDFGEAYQTYEKSLLRDIKVSSNDFYRTDTVEHVSATTNDYVSVNHLVSNEALYHDVPSVFAFTSTIDEDFTSFNKLTGNIDALLFRVCYFSNNGRSRINFLEDVKYIVCSDEKKSPYVGYGYSVDDKLSSEDRLVYKCDVETSLGYVYSNCISLQEYEKMSCLERQEALMYAAVVDDSYSGYASYKTFNEKDHNITKLKFNIEKTEGITIENGIIDVKNKGAKLVLTPETISNSELYLCLNNLRRIPMSYDDYKKTAITDESSLVMKSTFAIKNLSYTPDKSFDIFVYKDGIRRIIRNLEGKTNQSFDSNSEYLTNLGYYDISDSAITIEFSNPGEYTYDDIQLFSLSQDDFVEQASKLSANRLKVTERKNDYIKGTVDSDGGLLFFSIINSGGWSVWVDGERKEVIPANVGFIGVDISEGHHEVELKYMPIGMPYSIFFSGAGIAGCVGIGIFHDKKRRELIEKQ